MATFTDLARGKGTWDGQLELSVDLSPANDRMVSAEFTSLPILVPDEILHQKQSVRRRSRMTPAGSARSVRGDRELFLPKTYTTRKGALVLFTPPGEFSLTDYDKVYLNKAFSSETFVDYASTFGSLACLAQSVLMYGDNEAKEEDVSISDKYNKTNMRFLHTPHDKMLDTRSQPGGDVSQYLRELRSRCSTTSSFKAMSDDGKDTKPEENSWPGDTLTTTVTTSEMVTVDGDTLIGHYSTPVSHVSVTMSPERPMSSSPMSSRRGLPGDRLMTSVKMHPYHVDKTILEVATPMEPPSRAPTPVMQTSLAESLSYQSGRSSLSTSDDDTLAELNNYEVRSLDDFEPYPSYDGVQAIAGSRTDYSDELSIDTMHSMERSTLGGVHVDVGGAAQPLLPIYGGSFQTNGNTWYAGGTSPCQPVSTPTSSTSDDSARDDGDALNVIKVEVTSHQSSDFSGPTVSPKAATGSPDGRRSEKRWLSGSGSSSEKQLHSPGVTATTPNILARPPHPPSVPISASRRSSVASMRSFQFGGSDTKARSDIDEGMSDSESSSTRVHKGVLESQKSRSKLAMQRESMSKRNAKSFEGHEAARMTAKSVKTKSDDKIAVAGLGERKQLTSESCVSDAGVMSKERQVGEMVSEVGADKVMSEVDKMAASAENDSEGALVSKSSNSEAELENMKGVDAEKTPEGDMATKTTEAGSLFNIAKKVAQGIPKEKIFEKIVKKKVVKKTRKNDEIRQKRMSIIAEKEALRESRRLEKQRALDNAEELQRQIQERDEAMAKAAEEKDRENEKVKEQLAEAQHLIEAKEAEKKAKVTARKVAREERDARRKSEAERKKEAAVQRRSEHKLMQESARQKELDMLMTIADQEQRKRVAEEEGKSRRKEEEMAKLKEEEEQKYEIILANQREAEKLAELEMKAEVDEMNRLIQEKEEADKRAEMMQRRSVGLEGADFDIQMALAEQQLQQHEDVELRRLLKEQRAVHAEIERRQKLLWEQEELEEQERRDLVQMRELSLQRQSYNLEQSTHLRNMRVSQGTSRPWTFSYYVSWPLSTYSKFGTCDVQGKQRTKSGKRGKKGRKHKGKK